ncbi:transporter [Actinosynnema sp. NPDC004786]
MTWLAWRQLRLPVVSVHAAIVLIAVVLVATRPGRGTLDDHETLYSGGLVAVHVLPALLAVFWAVPMITRELEAGTHNLVWSQSVTRTRWLAVKLGVGVPAAALTAGLLSLVVTWWADPIDTDVGPERQGNVGRRLAPVVFAARGIAPVGYAVFAFVLAVAVAVLVRRTLPAMAVTLVLFAAVQVVVPYAVRPHLLPPTEEPVAITAQSIAGIRTEEGSGGEVPESLTVREPGGAWVLVNETVDANGVAVRPLPEAVRHCLPSSPADAEARLDLGRIRACFAGLSDLGYHQRLAYHPAGRFWALQWLELALFLAVSAPLTWFCFRRLRHLS